ncbi:MAG: hypothetical protein V3T72_19055 [Thermoanaerobaculia bacterium]
MTRAGRIATVIVACCVAAATNAAAEAAPDDSRWRRPDPARGVVPDDDELLRRGAVFGEVYIRTDNVFDPEEPGQNRFLYRLANRLHATTRPAVIERQLLFRRGDPYDPRVLQETARLLRSLGFLYDVWIEPIRYRGNRVDVLVRTRDVWTLGVGAGFERSGGENSFGFNLDESNLFGSGRFFDVKYTDDHDRSSSRIRFVDPALFGTRAELRLWYADNSDGHRRVFDLERPFFSLDSRWAGSTKLISDRRIERIYHRATVTERYHHESTFAELVSGLSKGYRDGRTRRWLFGYTYDRDRFWAEGAFPGETLPDGPAPYPYPYPDPTDPRPHDPDKNGASPAVVPPNRRLSYFWIGYEEVEDRFFQTRNMDRIQRTEDFNLGLELRARLGWSAPSWGGDESQAVFAADVRSGFAPTAGSTVFVSGYAAGRWGSGGHENVRVGGAVRYFLRTFGRHQLLATVHADAAWNLDPENQLLLGGDSGLRGYPARFQDGDRRFLISLEHRFYTDWELFDLVHVGAAVFLDAGHAWYDDGPRRDDDLGLLKDVGLGLRLGSSRSARGQLVHLDVAFPMDGGSQKVQWLVTSKSTF